MKVEREDLLNKFKSVRQASLSMVEPLSSEDFQIQSMPEVSPPKWNLGHTSWFYWWFILRERGKTSELDESYRYFLNSYYNIAGINRIPRDRRGLVARPTLKEIFRYRESVDTRMEELILASTEEDFSGIAFLVTVGLHHEQQHQELFYTEIKHIYWSETQPPLRPAYCQHQSSFTDQATIRAAAFIPFPGGLLEHGNLEGGWCWDNELPVHKAHVEPFSLMDRLVTNGEYLEFMKDGGYANPLLWLSNGWYEIHQKNWRAPLYWEQVDDEWYQYTLSGRQALNRDEPVCHLSYYEADAYAIWKAETDANYRGARIPTEYEWEHAVRSSGNLGVGGNLLNDGKYHPVPAEQAKLGILSQMIGDVWEWTASAYLPYPGYQPFPKPLTEYTEKFMDGQYVLRGGSCVTPRDHIRISYRNFWHPATRFQFSGFRLAKNEA